ncbi:ribose-phosphate pyrophosphokinase [Anaeromicropila herbilytica]|uniref:ribose-phosphate diphosphokinase n=1 Tax=Anaeromicropila herbilytica TaxID=2785025 RepID=A0A7R7ID87_9FIRM|nr:ribose-phosphate pyrophosphokinase [Anaeromicropila herbilytica]BCN31312.1 phosphoribosylpyrophosphate synthetase [Anaeromicropila herbilytica]
MTTVNIPTSESIPVAPLKIIALDSCKSMGDKVNDYIVDSRHSQVNQNDHTLAFLGYEADNYLANAVCPRFGSGEAKAVIKESIRGTDLYILVDVTNREISYNLCGNKTFMSPDDHFQDLKRIIAASNGKAHRINVIMPYLYEGRQHKRSKRESLDCALALQELSNMGVDNIITFDAHDPRVQNATPIRGFDNFYTTLQFIRQFLYTEKDLKIDKDNLIIISPDEGGMSRSIYYTNVLGVDMGMFYKRRDYSTIVNGKNPIIEHQYLGRSIENKDVFIVDDMISSGESILEVASELKKRKARRVFIAATYGLFSEGFDKFDKAYEDGIIHRIYTTNLSYCSQELLDKPYYECVDISKYIALIIDTLNHDTSVDKILNPTTRIQELLESFRNGNLK